MTNLHTAFAQKSTSLFALGRLLISQGSRRLFNGKIYELIELIGRHHSGDWGLISDEDWQSNDLAMRRGWRILSVYRAAGELVWIITEGDRSATTVLLPDEY